MPILVTGGCGFIGLHLVEMLQDRGHDVRILDDMSTGSWSNVRPNTEVIVGSVDDERAVTAAMAGVEGCFHLAAIPSVDRCNIEWSHTSRVNLGGTINVLQAAHTVSRPGNQSRWSTRLPLPCTATIPLCRSVRRTNRARSLPTGR